jgi:UDP-3-O-[3-hydroxymyristoyl] glucosamine N-acyltransferase
MSIFKISEVKSLIQKVYFDEDDITRYENGGGLVSKTVFIHNEKDVFIGKDSYISENVFIKGKVKIGNNVNICGSIKIINESKNRLLTIEDDVVINGDINIHGVCTIKKSAIILDNVSIRGNIIIGANCLICGDVKLTGKTIVSDGLNMTGNETYHNKKLTDIMF